MGLFSLATLYPLWIIDYFPSVDGPAHVALAHIWRNLESPGFDLYREFYTASSLNNPNMLIYVLLYGLISFVPPFIAEKLVVSIFAVGLPWSVWYMTTYRNQLHGVVALLSFPLVYNYITFFGFYNFLFGTIFFCLVLGYWLRYRAVPDRPIFHGFNLSLLLVLAYFTHISSIVFTVMSICLLLAVEIIRNLFRAKYPGSAEVTTSGDLPALTQARNFIAAALPASLLSLLFILRIV